MDDKMKSGEADRIERDAKDIIEAGQELEKARERELELTRDEASIDAQIAELQRRKEADHKGEQEARDAEEKEEQRIADDLHDIEEARGGTGGGSHPEPAPKNVTIIINTVDYEEPKGKILYQRIVSLAYPDFAAFPNATYSIIYERGPKNNTQGVLSRDGSVEITNGMRFRVKRTGES
ncbi:multiubiquitin domain-containing protein [Methylobacterium sp. J-072]|uniref:multiubiquitin domain-containing protein n=1 Tax=Methylobacterium sp. J-072 TaxID=2836651 RepID=UPI001FBB4718|nr:multiubiquitin domain-containing protein [Methylobacterium sp. J-072]MCJ2090966.1 multiubiquitin domain-containing protein [Methylobacterium sp. J-072]